MDYTVNPLRKFEDAPVGTYPGVLRDIENTTRKVFETEDQYEDVLRFKFELTGPGGKKFYLNKDAKPLVSTKGALVQLLTQLNPSATAAAGFDLGKLWDVCRSAIGQSYLVSVVAKEKGNGTKIGTVMPNVQTQTVTSAQLDKVFDNDDINF